MLSGVGKLLEVLGGISCSSSSGLKEGSSPSSSDPSPSPLPDLSPYITGITVVASIDCQLQFWESGQETSSPISPFLYRSSAFAILKISFRNGLFWAFSGCSLSLNQFDIASIVTSSNFLTLSPSFRTVGHCFSGGSTIIRRIWTKRRIRSGNISTSFSHTESITYLVSKDDRVPCVGL